MLIQCLAPLFCSNTLAWVKKKQKSHILLLRFYQKVLIGVVFKLAFDPEIGLIKKSLRSLCLNKKAGKA